jgi:hypothetical protein
LAKTAAQVEARLVLVRAAIDKIYARLGESGLASYQNGDRGASIFQRLDQLEKAETALENELEFATDGTPRRRFRTFGMVAP